VLQPTTTSAILALAFVDTCQQCWEAQVRNFWLTSRATRRLGRLRLQELSAAARTRLAWFDWCDAHGGNVARTCRHFTISRSTFYYWRKRFDRQDLRTLEDRSSRPKRCKPRTWTSDEVLAVQALRERYPRWGKTKLQCLLGRAGMRLSVSRVGRILRYLKTTGKLIEPAGRLSMRRRRPARPYAVRKPKGFVPVHPGDLIQLDTVYLQPLPGYHLKQFTFVDAVSRWSVAFLAHDATSHSAKRAFAAALARFPFPVRAVQVDRGSEFMSVFEEDLRERGIPLYALPPHSPKLNGRVERTHRTYKEEFYECSADEPTVKGLSQGLRRYEVLYNTVRPHQALGYLTPAEFLARHHQQEALSERS
jgi:transposase InsO family protein